MQFIILLIGMFVCWLTQQVVDGLQ